MGTSVPNSIVRNFMTEFETACARSNCWKLANARNQSFLSFPKLPIVNHLPVHAVTYTCLPLPVRISSRPQSSSVTSRERDWNERRIFFSPLTSVLSQSQQGNPQNNHLSVTCVIKSKQLQNYQKNNLNFVNVTVW